MSYAAGGCMLGGAFGGPAGAMIGGIAGNDLLLLTQEISYKL